MKVKEYAQLIGRSEQFVRVACQQGQIRAIVNKHKSRNSYEILEGNYEQENNQEGDQMGVIRSVGDRNLRNLWRWLVETYRGDIRSLDADGNNQHLG